MTSLGYLAAPQLGTGLPIAVALVAALVVGAVLRVVAKARPHVRQKFVQTLELRIALLIVVILASRTAPTNSIGAAVSGAALIILSASLMVGFDGTFLGRTRTVILIAFVCSYLGLLVVTYYQINNRASTIFQSYQFQLASTAAILFFIIQPIIANHELYLNKHIVALQEHTGEIRKLLEWQAQRANYGYDADGYQTTLVVPMEKVRPDLERRRDEGKKIYERFNHSHSSIFEEIGIQADHWYWHTRGLLERWFSNNAVAEEFVASRGSKVRSYRGFNYDNASNMRSALRNQITCIEGILRRLEVYDLPAPTHEEPAENAESAKEKGPVPSYITYRFSGPVGQLIAGEGQTVRNINSHIAAVVGLGQENVGEALLRLSEATLADPQLDDSSRAQILESIEDLADAAEASPNERKSGRIRGAIEVIGQMAGVATQLGEVWNQWGPIITQHLH